MLLFLPGLGLSARRWQKDEQRQLLLLTKGFVRLAAKVALDGLGRDVVNRILSFETANKMESLEKLTKPELAVRCAPV